MKTAIFVLLAVTVSLMTACSSCSTKDKINKVGDVTGQAMGEFAAGMAHGVEKAIEIKVDLPANLTNQGIKLGKTTVSCDSVGKDNLLVVYMIFDKDFSGSLTAKAVDNKGLEMGRTTASVTAKKNEAKYVEFHFDKWTNIDSDSKLTIE